VVDRIPAVVARSRAARIPVAATRIPVVARIPVAATRIPVVARIPVAATRIPAAGRNRAAGRIRAGENQGPGSRAAADSP
jgi:hypothetical protein